MVCRRAVLMSLPAILLVAGGMFLTFFTFSSGCQAKINKNQVRLLSTVRVSLSATGVEGNAEVVLERPDISDNGRFVVFSSKADNLVSGITLPTSVAQVYLRDNLLRTTVLVSQVPQTTNAGDGASTQPTISGDGRYVVFASTATNLSLEDGDAIQDIFVRDMTIDISLAPSAGAIKLVSRVSGANGVLPLGPNKANGSCNNPRISKDGRYAVFDSAATNLVAADSNSDKDVYRRDIAGFDPGFPTILISTRSDGLKGTGGQSNFASICRDGHLITFVSTCQDMVPLTADGGPKGGTKSDIFVHNANSGRTIRVSLGISTGPLDPNGDSSNPMISGDGNFVVWQSNASHLNIADDSSSSDIFLRDITSLALFPAGVIEIISVHSSGAQAGAGCDHPMVNEDGRFIVWDSPSTNLVNGDSNNRTDIFLRDRQTLQTSRVSVATFGGELNADSRFPSLSIDGRYVVFHSQATNAADDDTNGAGDFYLRGPPF